jgi:2'-5' RNA ligase
VRIGIVLLLDNKTEVKVREASVILNDKFPCFFKLDSTHIPHLTLLHAEIKDENFEKVLDCVKSIVNSNDVINLDAQDLRNGTVVKTFIGIYFKNDVVLNLQKIVLNKINKYLEKILPFFDPHITITRLKRDEDVDAAMSEIKGILQNKFVFSFIGICRIGENGTCASVIKSMSLSNP